MPAVPPLVFLALMSKNPHYQTQIALAGRPHDLDTPPPARSSPYLITRTMPCQRGGVLRVPPRAPIRRSARPVGLWQKSSLGDDKARTGL